MGFFAQTAENLQYGFRGHLRLSAKNHVKKPPTQGMAYLPLGVILMLRNKNPSLSCRVVWPASLAGWRGYRGELWIYRGFVFTSGITLCIAEFRKLPVDSKNK